MTTWANCESVEAIRNRNKRMGECSECDKHLDIDSLLVLVDAATEFYFGEDARYRVRMADAGRWTLGVWHTMTSEYRLLESAERVNGFRNGWTRDAALAQVQVLLARDARE